MLCLNLKKQQMWLVLIFYSLRRLCLAFLNCKIGLIKIQESKFRIIDLTKGDTGRLSLKVSIITPNFFSWYFNVSWFSWPTSANKTSVQNNIPSSVPVAVCSLFTEVSLLKVTFSTLFHSQSKRNQTKSKTSIIGKSALNFFANWAKLTKLYREKITFFIILYI